VRNINCAIISSDFIIYIKIITNFAPEYGYFSHQVSFSGTTATVAGDAVGMFSS